MFSSKMIIIIFTIILVSLILLLVRYKFSKYFKRVYSYSLNFLAKHKLLALILSHGGIQMIVIIICVFIIILLYTQIMRNNETKFNQIIYTFYGDTLKNYKLNYINFKKDIYERSGDFYHWGDLELEYGFKTDRNTNNKKLVDHIFTNDTSTFDLISKMEYLSVNFRKDSLIDKKRINVINQYIAKIYRQTSHHRFYYNYSFLRDSTHIFKLRFDAKDPLKDWSSINPYHCMWIGINFKCETELNDKSIIRIVYNKIDYTDSLIGIKQPITLDKVYPQPTTMTLTELVYTGNELETVLKQGGIYITGVEPERKGKVDRLGIILSVLLGTIAAFILDVLVHLIIKWKHLKITSKGN